MRVSFVKAVNNLVSIFVNLHTCTWIMYNGKIHTVQYIKSQFNTFSEAEDLHASLSSCITSNSS